VLINSSIVHFISFDSANLAFVIRFDDCFD